MVIENAKKSKLKGEKTIDLKEKYIMPSLADAHVHLPETEEELQRMFDLNLISVHNLQKVIRKTLRTCRSKIVLCQKIETENQKLT